MTATGEFAIAALSGTEVQPSRTKAQPLRTMGGKSEPRHLLTSERGSLQFKLEFVEGDPLNVEIVGDGNEPTSLWRVLTKIQEFSKLEPGWDSYQAKPLDPRAVRRCFSLLPYLLQDAAPPPNVILTNLGGLQFEWHRGGVDFEVIVRPSGPVQYYFSDADAGVEQEWEGVADRHVLRAILARLSQTL